MAYTDAQIKEVCTAASEAMKGFADVQNCTFPSAAIIAGMKAGKTAEQVGTMAYESIKDLQPTFKDGYNQVAQPNRNPMLNIAQFMEGAVREAIKTIDAANSQQEQQQEEVVVIKCTVSFNSNTGTGTMQSVEVNKDSSYSLPECTFTAPEGKEFDYWELNNEKISTESITVSSDIELKAIWKDATVVPNP